MEPNDPDPCLHQHKLSCPPRVEYKKGDTDDKIHDDDQSCPDYGDRRIRPV